MLDIKLFRENLKLIKDSEKKRFKDTKNVDAVIKFDEFWRKETRKLQNLRAKKNTVSEEINQLKKRGKPVTTKIKAMKGVVKQIQASEKKADNYLRKRDDARYTVGNILDKSVPVAETEEGNIVVRKWGKIKKFNFKPKHQADLIVELDGADLDRAAKLVGSRFYFLKNELAILNFAILRYAFDYLIKNGFTPIWSPVLLKHEYMRGAAELGDFEEQLYKVEGSDLYLIATSEQTLASFHSGEILHGSQLPLQYTAYSPCFRREAGSHGKDTKGIFRVHQFDKIEQYVYCHPSESWGWHEKMIKITEGLFKELEIPYRIVNIASGEMNDNGAKKYDIEGWFPAQNKYRELGSCTNCTDYQARKLNVRFVGKNGEKGIVHTLNNTTVATERFIACLLENHQQENGSVRIPKKLWKYTGFKVIRPKKAKK